MVFRKGDRIRIDWKKLLVDPNSSGKQLSFFRKQKKEFGNTVFVVRDTVKYKPFQLLYYALEGDTRRPGMVLSIHVQKVRTRKKNMAGKWDQGKLRSEEKRLSKGRRRGRLLKKEQERDAKTKGDYRQDSTGPS